MYISSRRRGRSTPIRRPSGRRASGERAAGTSRRRSRSAPTPGPLPTRTPYSERSRSDSRTARKMSTESAIMRTANSRSFPSSRSSPVADMMTDFGGPRTYVFVLDARRGRDRSGSIDRRDPCRAGAETGRSSNRAKRLHVHVPLSRYGRYRPGHTDDRHRRRAQLDRRAGALPGLEAIQRAVTASWSDGPTGPSRLPSRATAPAPPASVPRRLAGAGVRRVAHQPSRRRLPPYRHAVSLGEC